MPSDSQRLYAPPDIRQYEEWPVTDSASVPPVSGGEEGDGASPEREHVGARLWREGDKVLYQESGMEKPEPVRVLWARPLSGRGGAVSVVMAAKKKEVAYFPDLSVLPEESRVVAMEELGANVVMPVIREIVHINPRFGNYYWDVDTDMGRRTFLLLSPESNTVRPSADSVILRDVSGNCYEIRSIAALSQASLREMDKVL